MTDLATRLLEARKQKGLSQQQVAEIAGVHFTNVGKYERAESVPSADVFNRIAKALEVSPLPEVFYRTEMLCDGLPTSQQKL